MSRRNGHPMGVVGLCGRPRLNRRATPPFEAKAVTVIWPI